MIKAIQNSKFIYFFPILLFLVNLVSKSVYIAVPEVSHDEPFSIYHAQFNVLSIINILKGYNNPPLYEIVLHFWIKIFGISAASVRALPMLFAALSPVGLFFLGKKYFSLRVGVISSILLSCSNLVTYHAHDCRVYTLFLLLSILSMYYFMEILMGQLPKLRAKTLFVLFSTLLIYAHYFGFFVLFIQGLHILIFYRRAIVRMLAFYAGITLLYVPHAVVLLTRFKKSVGGTWLEPPAGIESLYNMIWSFSNAPVIAVSCIALLMIGLTLTFVKRNGSKGGFLITSWFLVPFLGMFLISFAVPMYISRYLLYSIPAFYLLLALCIEKVSVNIWIRNAVASLFIIGFTASTNLNPVKNTHMTELVAEVKVHKSTNTAVLLCPFDLIDSFSYNYDRNAFAQVSDQKEYHLTDSLLKNNKIFFGCDLMTANHYEDLIYVVERGSTPEQDTIGVGEAGFKLDYLTQVGDITKVFYLKKR